jgi:hypothetical protein
MKIRKKIKTIVIIFCILQIVMTIALSINSNAGFITDVFEQSSNFRKFGENKADNMINSFDSYMSVFGELFNLVWFVAFIAVIVKAAILIPSLKGDNPAEVAESKKKIITYLILLLIIAGAYKIWNFAVDFFDGLID